MEAIPSLNSLASSASFSFSDLQRELLQELASAREQAQEEEQWENLRQREDDLEALRAIAGLLQASGFPLSDLSYEEMSRLLRLVRTLAANPNLDSRLLHFNGEPALLNRDLKLLLYGEERIQSRLATFLARRRTGSQTAMQWLSAVFPEQWPLVSVRGMERLRLTPEQVLYAQELARKRFPAAEEDVLSPDSSVSGTPVSAENPQVIGLLADVIVFQAARDLLDLPDYLALHRVLTQTQPRRSHQSRRRLAPLLYELPTTRYRTHLQVQENGDPEDRNQSESLSQNTLREAKYFPIANLHELKQAPLLKWLETWIAARGFTYPALLVRDFYLSLQSKPLLLLSGLSGTGKTSLTALFAEGITGNPDTQYRLLPVRPDWTDSTPLLGYVNLLAEGGEGRIVSTPFLDFMRRAAHPDHAGRAFFLCLDEMNLARIEYYFAEILSVMEIAPSYSRRELLLPGNRSISLPDNLFFCGTLNHDEATYSISRKVLDRANNLHFSAGSFMNCQSDSSSPRPDAPYTLAERQALFLKRRVRSVQEAQEKLRSLNAGDTDLAAEVSAVLEEVNSILRPAGFPFAYRVRDETLRYCANSFDSDGTPLLLPEEPTQNRAIHLLSNMRTALDLQLLHRVLPRLSGPRDVLETPLHALAEWTSACSFPHMAERISRMQEVLKREGFVSFETT